MHTNISFWQKVRTKISWNTCLLFRVLRSSDAISPREIERCSRVPLSAPPLPPSSRWSCERRPSPVRGWRTEMVAWSSSPVSHLLPGLLRCGRLAAIWGGRGEWGDRARWCVRGELWGWWPRSIFGEGLQIYGEWVGAEVRWGEFLYAL
jgi:hypothetical protein